MSSPISSGNVTNSVPKLSSPAVRDAGPSSEKGSVNGESQGLSNPTVTRDSVAIKQGESSLLDLKGFRHEGDDIGFDPAGWAMDVDGLLVGDTPEFGALREEPEIAVDDFDAIRTDAITGMFQDLLGREPEAEGLQFYFDSDLSLDEIKEHIANSPERQTKIDEMYQELLGREAEEEGLNYWAGSGLSLDEIKEHIANSPERRTNAITEMYQEILGREPEAEGLQFWFDSGLSLDEVKAGIANSPERRTKAITEMYQEILGREPDAEGLQFYFDSDLSLETIRAQIADSPEAAARGTVATERETGITQIYRELLGYDPEPEDLKLWAESSFTLDEIRAVIARSVEGETPDVAELLKVDRL